MNVFWYYLVCAKNSVSQLQTRPWMMTARAFENTSEYKCMVSVQCVGEVCVVFCLYASHRIVIVHMCIYII